MICIQIVVLNPSSRDIRDILFCLSHKGDWMLAYHISLSIPRRGINRTKITEVCESFVKQGFAISILAQELSKDKSRVVDAGFDKSTSYAYKITDEGNTKRKKIEQLMDDHDVRNFFVLPEI